MTAICQELPCPQARQATGGTWFLVLHVRALFGRIVQRPHFIKSRCGAGLSLLAWSRFAQMSSGRTTCGTSLPLGLSVDVSRSQARWQRPVIDGQFHVTFLRCAQECAHSIAAIRDRRLAEPIVDSRLKAKATVFRKRASKIRLRRKNSRDLQVLTQRILTSLR